ncbi:MAG: phosphoribosylglycinamide formyltransferase [Flammeovirgaceae bacterium TMED290]|nr:MAG: phosphoribosylglycinamide formyltransferase [Flammeovirgaceae bacterium TMED290]
MKLAVLGSTNGTDLDAIIAAIKNQEIDASIEVVISNVKSSGILAKAKKYYIDYYYISHKNKKRDVFDLEMSQILELKKVDLILLIGFMRILSSSFIDRWAGRIVNVHPSLLPKYAGGMNEMVHESVLRAGDKETGCTIHLVTKEVDGGPILLQLSCPVEASDTVEDLKNKVQKLEGRAFVNVIKNWRNYEQ